jgi:hypothetical protein
MDTDRLVAMLARDAEPVARGAAGRRFSVALVAGTVAAVVLMLALLGLRPDLREAFRDAMFWVKLGVPALLLASGLAACTRLGRPGSHVGSAAVVLLLPIAAIWLLAALALASAPTAARIALVLGDSSAACVVSIALLATPTFIAAFWAMKGLAPTRPALAGAFSGLVAGAAGALVYSWHCPEMAAPFIATWYLLGIAVPAVVGALLGPVLLRW